MCHSSTVPHSNVYFSLISQFPFLLASPLGLCIYHMFTLSSVYLCVRVRKESFFNYNNELYILSLGANVMLFDTSSSLTNSRKVRIKNPYKVFTSIVYNSWTNRSKPKPESEVTVDVTMFFVLFCLGGKRSSWCRTK